MTSHNCVNSYLIIDATARHGPQMLALLPELANFDIPARRQPEHLWQGDQALVQGWLAGRRPGCFGYVAVDGAQTVQGFAFVSLGEELLSHGSSAHLEILVIAPSVRRAGLGDRLTDAAEQGARARGAATITLHVFGNNRRARALYRKRGFDEEFIRCIKDL